VQKSLGQRENAASELIGVCLDGLYTVILRREGVANAVCGGIRTVLTIEQTGLTLHMCKLCLVSASYSSLPVILDVMNAEGAMLRAGLPCFGTWQALTRRAFTFKEGEGGGGGTP